MNVIIYVTTLLMVLAALTYAKLESTRSFASVRSAYHHYMKAVELGRNKEAAQKWYERITVLEKTKVDEAKVRAEGLSRISLYAFVNKGQNRSSDSYRQTRELLKLLIVQLYKDQVFFKEISAKNSNFLDEILNQIERGADSLSENTKIIRPGQLTRLKLEPNELQHTLTLILTGIPKLSPKDQIIAEKDEDKNDQDDEAIAKAESDEAYSQPGYVSLTDFTTFQNSTKIRIFLASRPILMAIYEDANVVDKIIERRKELYRQVRKDKNSIAPSTISFQSEFSQLGRAPDFASILNFAVTTTKPKD